MKKKSTISGKLILFVLLILSISKFSFILPEFENKPTSAGIISVTEAADTLLSGFLNYCLSGHWVDDPQHSYWNITNHLDYYEELNYNAAHMYPENSDSIGYWEQDSLRPDQRQRLDNIIESASQKGLRSIFERIRISNLCYSQRLIYEVGNGSGTHNRNINYGFVYENNMSNTFTTDSGRSVLHAKTFPTENYNSPGWLCSGIYENMQHNDLYYFRPGHTDTLDWKIKPVMRIKQSDFSPSDTTPVVAIITYNFNGDKIDSNVIKITNFRDNNFQYFGQYIDFYSGLLTPLQVSGSLVDSLSLNYGRLDADLNTCQVDFKVYWFGLVDVWFDKMIVDDERADELFASIYDNKIQDEAELLGSQMIFYLDEIVSSQAYTTKYVVDKLKEFNPNSKLEFAQSSNLNIHSHRNDETGGKLLFEVIQPDIVCHDAHVFLMEDNEQYRIYFPNTVTQYDPKVPSSWFVSPSFYNHRLQETAFGNKFDQVVPYQGTFIWQITKTREDLQNLSPGTKFLIQPQLHSWISTLSNGSYTEGGFREIFNEEIQASAMIAISHGAEGLNWFSYFSLETEDINEYKFIPTSGGSLYTCLGLRNNENSNFSKRESNMINQNKWEYVKEMNAKIKNWKPVLDAINWQSGWSVHHEGANNEFVQDILSMDPDQSGSNPCVEDAPTGDWYDCFGERYWELGFFEPDNTQPSYSYDAKSKYFLAVNRRCVPSISSNEGDERVLKIKFKASDLAGFNNWKLIDLNTNQSIVFNKNNQGSGGYVNLGITSGSLGYFQPGEGKLYKLAPVMQEGGTLVTDEVVAAEQIFTCKAPVFNNGHDLTIEYGVTVEFLQV